MVLQAPVLTAAGFVAAGGQSRRMGRDKALLPWGSGTLLGHALSRLRAVCSEVGILSGPVPRYEDLGAPVLVDAVPGVGPLGGLLTALRHLADPLDACVVLAVDLPFVPEELLRYLLERRAGHDAVVPLSPSGSEPLCAVYSRTCRRAVEARVSAGEFKMTSFWPDVRVRLERPEDLARFGDVAALFRNVNSPEDYSPGRT